VPLQLHVKPSVTIISTFVVVVVVIVVIVIPECLVLAYPCCLGKWPLTESGSVLVFIKQTWGSGPASARMSHCWAVGVRKGVWPLGRNCSGLLTYITSLILSKKLIFTSYNVVNFFI